MVRYSPHASRLSIASLPVFLCSQDFRPAFRVGQRQPGSIIRRPPLSRKPQENPNPLAAILRLLEVENQSAIRLHAVRVLR